MSDFSLDDPSFYEDFLVEAQEHFELIEQNFLTLEEAPGDLDILNAIFRSVHTIKGASGFLGLAKVQSLSHIGENILDDLRKGRMTVTPEVMELLFETVDILKVLVDDVGINLRKQGAPKDPDITRSDPPPGGLPERRRRAQGRRRPRRRPASLPAASSCPRRLEDLDAEARKAIEDGLSAGGSRRGAPDRAAARPARHALQSHVHDLHGGSGGQAAALHQPHEARPWTGRLRGRTSSPSTWCS